MKTIIKKATKKDIPILLKFMMELQDLEHGLSNRIRADKKTKDFFKNIFIAKRINNPDYKFLIAWEDKKPVGICTGWKEYISPSYKNEYVGYVCQLIVCSEHRKKGIGKELLKKLASEFKQMGIKELKLEVALKNKKSIAFWKTLGFENLYLQMRKDL